MSEPTLQSIASSLDAVNAKLAEAQKAREEARKGLPTGAPHVRSGEDPLSSRGYSYLKAWGLVAGQLDRDSAKVEAAVADRLRKYYDGCGFKKSLPNSIFIPLAADFLTGDEQLSREVREEVRAGNPVTVGMDEIRSVRSRMASMGYTKALSWIDETLGGAFVAPPQFGELIEVLRNNAVLLAAGARTVPMPPQGRLTLPRQTSAMTAYHVGEASTLTNSDVGTGDVTLQAKKLTVLAKIPNELFHFSAIPIEAFVREDMGKVIALKMDKTLLEDAGSTTTPKGIINYASINTVTPKGTAADGNSGYTIQPEDISNIIATTEEQNAEFRAFLMRPLLWATLFNRRSDAVTAGDGKGPFLFNIVRDVGMDVGAERLRVGTLNGYPVFKTTQLSKTRTRGSGSTNNTYVLGGNFSDLIVAMGGAMEFALSTQGDTPFTADQTWLRGTMYYDSAPRHEASFTLLDNLLQNT